MDNPSHNIISDVKKGVREAFDELCMKYYAMMLSYAKLFLKDEWAEDVVQDVFFNVWQNREKLDEKGNITGYLIKSVYNRSMNYLQKNKRCNEYRIWTNDYIESLSSTYLSTEYNPTISKLFNSDLKESLDHAISQLPAKCREVFRLSYIENFTNKEISHKLGISVSTVENHMYLALKKLRSILADERLLVVAICLMSEMNI